MRKVFVLFFVLAGELGAQSGGARGSFSFDTRGYPVANFFAARTLPANFYMTSDLDVYGHKSRIDPFDLSRFQWRFRTGFVARGGAGIVAQYHDFNDSLGIARLGVESISRFYNLKVAVRLYPLQSNGGAGLATFAFGYNCCNRCVVIDGYFDLFIDGRLYVAEVEANFFLTNRLIFIVEGKHSDLERTRHVGVSIGLGYVF